MGNDSIPNCLNHKDNRNIQTRLDYMLLFRNETKAKIIRIMETWTDQKRAEWYKLQKDNKEAHAEEPPEEALWVTMSYEEFSTYAYGTMNHDTIKKNVDELVVHEYMQRRPHPISGLAPQYLLDTKLLQEVLDEQELPSLFDDIGKIRPPRKKHTPQEKYPQGEGINTPRVGGNIPPGTGDFSYPSNNTTKNLLESSENKGERATSLQEDRNAPINLEVAKKKRETNPRMLALTVSSHSQRLSETSEEEEEDETPTEKVKAIKKGYEDARNTARDHISARDNTRLDMDMALSDTQGSQGNQRGSDEPLRRPKIASQQSPGAGTRSLAAAALLDGGQDDGTSDQASLTLALGTPVQRSGIPSGLPPSPDAAQGGNSPPMAMTARQIKAQNEKRAKELWIIIEDELHTTFTDNQRKSHKDGIASLIADDLSDEAIRTGLQALNTFERRTFTVSKFYGWLPTLSAKAPIFLKKASNGYQRDMVEWQGRYMTIEEADELGFNGGFGAYL